jgi:hypothetical protein
MNTKSQRPSSRLSSIAPSQNNKSLFASFSSEKEESRYVEEDSSFSEEKEAKRLLFPTLFHHADSSAIRGGGFLD